MKLLNEPFRALDRSVINMQIASNSAVSISFKQYNGDAKSVSAAGNELDGSQEATEDVALVFEVVGLLLKDQG